MNKTMFPPSIINLLLQEGQRYIIDGQERYALGTGIIPICATSRGGKTSLAYVMLDYVIRYTNRPIILDNFPQKVIDNAIPKSWRGRVSNMPFHMIAEVDEPAVWLVDDTGTGYNSRDWQSNKLLSRSAGILSHFGGGQTVIFTTQLMSGVDVSFFRYTNISPVIRYIDPDVMRFERPEFIDMVKEGQWELSKVSSGRFLDYFYTVKDKLLCKSHYPDWLKNETNKTVKDMLSRPMRYHELDDKKALVMGKEVNTWRDKENTTE
jgi:hypothetical protein